MTKKKRITITLGEEENKILESLEKNLNEGKESIFSNKITKSDIVNCLIRRSEKEEKIKS